MYPRNQRASQQRPMALRPDAPTFHPTHRTQENNTVFQQHRTRELMIIETRVNFKQVVVLLDIESTVNIISKNLLAQIKGQQSVWNT
ncbi:hypothetical protein TNCT_129991 [Trichonephila clavata]|uniref:Uncharacterized protein n=1 Tax=Trichonephila clavata TaxID=2740835 RepID=A0A8X6GAU8_TRICU|nr:hypothetical protein TNCT_129991 [Trichonephila clavata]